jgi:hypothetical protein
LEQNGRQEVGGFFEKPFVPLAVSLHVVASRSGDVAGLEQEFQVCFLLRRQIRKHDAIVRRNEDSVRDTKRNVNRLWLVCRPGDAFLGIVVLGFNQQSFDDLVRWRGFGVQNKPLFLSRFSLANSGRKGDVLRVGQRSERCPLADVNSVRDVAITPLHGTKPPKKEE